MSAQRAVPPSAARRVALTLALITVAVLAATAGYFAGKRSGSGHDVMLAAPANAERIALVREAPCDGGTCQSLWIGGSRADAMQVATLAANAERCEEIAWAADGYRVGFVINGYQLRIFDGMTGARVRQLNLFEPDTTPSSRIARGVTFSQNGAAVTFDDCPRSTSGCKSSMAAVR